MISFDIESIAVNLFCLIIFTFDIIPEQSLMKTLKFDNLKLHLLVWAIFISYEVLVVYSISGKRAGFWDYALHYLLNIFIFYFNSHIVLPNAVGKDKNAYVRLPIMVLCELLIYLMFRYLLVDFYHLLNIKITESVATVKYFIITSSFRGVYFIFLSTGYWFALSTIQNRKKIASLEKMQLKQEIQHQQLETTLLATENAYLKSQINPHFLLNTLNFLYNSVSKFSDKVADSVMTLSEIMRYALTNSGEDGKVKLEDELEHVSNFIKLNQARFSQRLCIVYEVNGEVGELRIIPLVLITLVENLFKYGDLLNETDPAKITATIEGNELVFVTENVKKKNVREAGHGIGLKNITERLKMYHEYDLKIEENDQFYRSVLTIRL